MLLKYKKYKELIEVFISAILMIGLIIYEDLLSHFNFFNVVYVLLAYIIILELVRMLGEYIVTHHISIRLVIDTFIIFMLRESILIYSDKSMDMFVKSFYLIVGLIMVYILFDLRRRAINQSPIDKCLSCEHYKPTELQ